MRLLIDAGNTLIKSRLSEALALYDGLSIPRSEVIALGDLPWDSIRPFPTSIVLSNVAGPAVESAVRKLAERWQVPLAIVVPQTEAFGVRNGYQRPERLGVDRWLALIAACSLTERAFFVIDCGTALTLDYVWAGEHQGGAIFPGRRLLERTLQENTSLVAPNEEGSFHYEFGRNTDQCISLGAVAALAGGVNELVRKLGPHDEQAEVFITGGDSAWLMPHLDSVCRYVPDLVFHGLALWAEREW